MANTPPKTEIAKTLLKLSLTHTSNRCESCGRRLKYQPGAWINLTGDRFTTCRSCGHENPTLMEKVAESLTEAGYDVPGLDGILGLPNCLEDGIELQVSRDFTKVFCYGCGREWERYDFEEIMGQAISPRLAGAIPVNRDNSKIARELEVILNDQDVDAGTPFFVVNVFEASTKSSFKTSLKNGWHGIQHYGLYLAIYEDAICLYSWNGETLIVDRKDYVELFTNTSEDLKIPFDVSFFPKSLEKNALNFLIGFRNIYLANSAPFQQVLFGAAAKEQQELLSEQQRNDKASMTDELLILGELYTQGLLTSDEFREAKLSVIKDV